MSTEKRLLGDGWEPHVNEVDGHLLYSIPVESGIVSMSFEFPITAEDLDVLKADLYRYTVLYFVLHELLQRTFGQGTPKPHKMPLQQFQAVAKAVLHSSGNDLEAYVRRIQREKKISIVHLVKDFMARKQAAK